MALTGAQPVAIVLPAAMKIDTGKSRIGGKAFLFALFLNRPDQLCMRFMKVAIHLFPRVRVLLAWRGFMHFYFLDGKPALVLFVLKMGCGLYVQFNFPLE